MVSRTALATFIFQGVLLAGLVGVGAAVYQLKLDAESRGADTALAQIRPAQTGVEESPKATGAPDPLLELTRRIKKIEFKISTLIAAMDKTSESKVAERTRLREQIEEDPQGSPAEMQARADLRGRFERETTTSPWGKAAASAIEDASLTAAANSPFFAEHGGSVLADCKESVCNLAWSPTSPTTSQLSVDEKAEMLDRARWELLALVGNVEDGGQLRVIMDSESDPPTIELMVDHNTESSANLPDKVSRYLGKVGTK